MYVVLIVIMLLGQLVRVGELLFYMMVKCENDFEDFVMLFFELVFVVSCMVVEFVVVCVVQCKVDLSLVVLVVWVSEQVGDGLWNLVFLVDVVFDVLCLMLILVFYVGGDYDIVFLVENWYVFNGQLLMLYFVMLLCIGYGL